jgi:PQQ-dependent dehydrogenase (methanol/ethanol family)
MRRPGGISLGNFFLCGVTLATVTASTGCRDHVAAAATAPPAAAATIPHAANVAAPSSVDGEWPLAGRDPRNTRFSGLAEITTANVAGLRAAWTFSTGTTKGQEAAPLVVAGTMYYVTPYPNVLYALDLTRPGAPVKWKFEPNPLPASQGVACCDVVNRGAAYADGSVYFNSLDNRTFAIDAATGAQRWVAPLGDIQRGETMTMAPLVVHGKVLVGNSGGEMGVRGWLTALDAASGKIAWRAYNTGPDADVLIGPEFHPFYARDRGKDLGVHTWPPQAWQIGGGTVWGFVSYDADTDLVYYGSGNPGPWNPDQRPGDNKWTCTVFARRLSDGHAVWAYQVVGHDTHDYDGVNENVIVDLPLGGRMRKVILRPDRNGYLYVMDRPSGEVLSAQPFAFVNSSHGVDLATGELRVAPEKSTGANRVVRDICPASPGAKDWQPSAWSPRTGLLYVPSNNLCMDYEGQQVSYIAGTPFVGASVKMYAGPGGARGYLVAWDPVHGRAAWKIAESFPVWSGVVATAGDLVFYGTMDGWFKAVDARDGRLLWKFKVGSGIVGQPVTYRGPDGRQYVAVASGVGGWAGAIVSGELDPNDPTAAAGIVNAMKDLPGATTKGGMLYAFALP